MYSYVQDYSRCKYCSHSLGTYLIATHVHKKSAESLEEACAWLSKLYSHWILPSNIQNSKEWLKIGTE